MSVLVGRHFILGFQGTGLPPWVEEFASEFGLGGVILFDYSVDKKNYDNNIESPAQVQALIREIHQLPGRPKVFIDQEGGKVRRLKESLGFAPLVSHQEFATWSLSKQKDHLRRSFSELKELGVDVNLGPVVDINYNPTSPDIGAYQRSFSSDINVVKSCALLWCEIAKEFDLELCLKHFPGLGSANQNSHESLTDISGLITPEQEELFYTLLPEVPGHHILVSHAVANEWAEGLPLSISEQAVLKVRKRFPKASIITDDMQMRALLAIQPLPQACQQAIQSGVDMICIGNNLMNHELELTEMARSLV